MRNGPWRRAGLSLFLAPMSMLLMPFCPASAQTCGNPIETVIAQLDASCDVKKNLVSELKTCGDVDVGVGAGSVSLISGNVKGCWSRTIDLDEKLGASCSKAMDSLVEATTAHPDFQEYLSCIMSASPTVVPSPPAFKGMVCLAYFHAFNGNSVRTKITVTSDGSSHEPSLSINNFSKPTLTKLDAFTYYGEFFIDPHSFGPITVSLNGDVVRLSEANVRATHSSVNKAKRAGACFILTPE